MSAIFLVILTKTIHTFTWRIEIDGSHLLCKLKREREREVEIVLNVNLCDSLCNIMLDLCLAHSRPFYFWILSNVIIFWFLTSYTCHSFFGLLICFLNNIIVLVWLTETFFFLVWRLTETQSESEGFKEVAPLSLLFLFSHLRVSLPFLLRVSLLSLFSLLSLTQQLMASFLGQQAKLSFPR